MASMATIQPSSPQANGVRGVKHAVIKSINPAGNWNAWSNEMKQELQRGANNTEVGQQIVFENSSIRIWDIRLQPKETLGFHRHRMPYYRTAMTAGTARAHYGDASIVEVTYPIGETEYFGSLSEVDYFIHSLANIGDTELIFCTVEILQ